MPRPIVAVPPYAKRAAPQQYSKGYFDQELGNIQRGMVRRNVRFVEFASQPDFKVVLANDDTIAVDATGGAITITLPPPEQVQFLTVTIKRMNSGANVVTIGGTIDGAASPILAVQYAAKTFQSTGSEFILLGSV